MDELLDYLEDCIEIFVLLQYNLIPFSCADCDSYTMDNNKCGVPYEEGSESVFYSKYTQKEYYTCPASMVPNIVTQWYDMYKFTKEFNVPMKEDDTPLMFWWFVKTYLRVTNTIEMKINEEKQKQMNKKRSHHT